MTVTFVSTTTGSETETYCSRPLGPCAAKPDPATNASSKPLRMCAMRSSLHGKRSHHLRRQMLRDVAVEHPAARITEVQQDIHLGSRRDEGRVLPYQILVRDTVYRQYQKSLPVRVNRMLHPVQRGPVVH